MPVALGATCEHCQREVLVRAALPEVLLAVDLKQDFAIGRDEKLLQLRRNVGERQAAVGLLGLEQRPCSSACW